jgi:hypothetical protein
MRILGVRLACLSSLMAPLFGGCTSINTPGDLALTSVQVVDWQEQKELPGPGVSPLFGLLSDHDLALMGQSVTGGPKPHRAMLKVEFTSAMNLPQFVIENSYNLANKTFFCDQPRTSPFMSFPDVFWHGVRLSRLEGNPITQNSKAPSVLNTYYIYVDVAREKVAPSNPPQNGFDLRQKPGDVCFHIGGGNESGLGYRSNIVIIPRDMIAAALQKSGSTR